MSSGYATRTVTEIPGVQLLVVVTAICEAVSPGAAS